MKLLHRAYLDAAQRARLLASVTDGTDSAAYSYLANSSLIEQIAFAHGGTTRMTTTRQYDALNRLTSISSAPTASAPASFNYKYNLANQRTADRLVDGSTWRYQYDALGQVVSGAKYWSDGTPVAGQQFGYNFDLIGNRLSTTAGGDQYGANLRVASYTNNSLNQITSRDVPGGIDVMGLALATSNVTVNGQQPYRKVEYFREQLGVTNTTNAVWQNVAVASSGQTANGNEYVAQTPEVFSYDLDGNLTQDGRWTYTWDAENRLVGMTSFTNAPAGSKLQLAFVYDDQGRRIQKVVSTNNGANYIGEYTNSFVYDGWNCVGVFNSSFNLLNSFLWGADLSGSMQGAGGVGGLLQVAYCGASTTNCFVAYDGNGNVMALANAADGTTVANYDYGPFGEAIRATGPMAKINPFRFSTKYNDDESDLLYYGYRYYTPSTGRWVNRDPIGEHGGPNIYMFVKNSSLDCIDFIGLWEGVIAYYKESSAVDWTPEAQNHISHLIKNAQWNLKSCDRLDVAFYDRPPASDELGRHKLSAETIYGIDVKENTTNNVVAGYSDGNGHCTFYWQTLLDIQGICQDDKIPCNLSIMTANVMAHESLWITIADGSDLHNRNAPHYIENLHLLQLNDPFLVNNEGGILPTTINKIKSALDLQ